MALTTVIPSVAVTPASWAGTLAARDPGSTRLVYGIVIVLVLLGLGLAWFAWWLVRTTRPDPELLAPLEAIQTRRWRRLDPAGRRRLLDELRPDGAEPHLPSRERPAVDDDFGPAPAALDVRELATRGAPTRSSQPLADGARGDAVPDVPDEPAEPGSEATVDADDVAEPVDEAAELADDLAEPVDHEATTDGDDDIWRAVDAELGLDGPADR